MAHEFRQEEEHGKRERQEVLDPPRGKLMGFQQDRRAAVSKG